MRPTTPARSCHGSPARLTGSDRSAVERAIALAGWRQYGGTAGPGAWPYTITIWEGSTDGHIAESGIPVPSPPAVGTTVLHEGTAWEVTSVRVLLPGARSRAAERGYPVHVEVIARRTGGRAAVTRG